jgi:hypothetical protein
MVHAMYVIGYIMRACNVMYVIIIIYYSWNGGRAEAVCAGGKEVIWLHAMYVIGYIMRATIVIITSSWPPPPIASACSSLL